MSRRGTATTVSEIAKYVDIGRLTLDYLWCLCDLSRHFACLCSFWSFCNLGRHLVSQVDRELIVDIVNLCCLWVTVRPRCE